MLVEELRLRKGSLAAAGYLMLTEQEVSGWQLSTTIYYISGQIVGKVAQWIAKFSGQVSPARLLVLQASSLLACSHLGCQMSLEKKEF